MFTDITKYSIERLCTKVYFDNKKHYIVVSM